MKSRKEVPREIHSDSGPRLPLSGVGRLRKVQIAGDFPIFLCITPTRQRFYWIFKHSETTTYLTWGSSPLPWRVLRRWGRITSTLILSERKKVSFYVETSRHSEITRVTLHIVTLCKDSEEGLSDFQVVRDTFPVTSPDFYLSKGTEVSCTHLVKPSPRKCSSFGCRLRWKVCILWSLERRKSQENVIRWDVTCH